MQVLQERIAMGGNRFKGRGTTFPCHLAVLALIASRQKQPTVFVFGVSVIRYQNVFEISCSL